MRSTRAQLMARAVLLALVSCVVGRASDQDDGAVELMEYLGTAEGTVLSDMATWPGRMLSEHEHEHARPQHPCSTGLVLSLMHPFVGGGWWNAPAASAPHRCHVGSFGELVGDGGDGNAKAARVRWDPKTSGAPQTIAELADRFEKADFEGQNCPVVVTGGILESTVPVTKWSLSTIAKAIGSGRSVSWDESSSPFITYFDNQTYFAKRVPNLGHRKSTGSVRKFVKAVERRGRTSGSDKSARRGSSSSGSSGSSSGSSSSSVSSGSDTTSNGAGGVEQKKEESFARYGGSLQTWAPEIWPDVAEYVRPGQGSRISLWIGSKGVVSTAHFDLFDNLYCMVKGTKVGAAARARTVPYRTTKRRMRHALELRRVPS